MDEGFIDTSEAATDPMVEDQTLLHTLQEKLRWVFCNIYEERIFKTRYLNKVKKEGSVFSWYGFFSIYLHRECQGGYQQT